MPIPPGPIALDTQCFCNSGKTHQSCCAPFLDGTCHPATAEQLMRSRYCAYVLHNAAYLLRTWHPTTRPAHLNLDDPPGLKWIGLKIVRTTSGTLQDDAGLVEFVARYKIKGKAGRLHEISRFLKFQDQWQYVEGEHPQL